MALICLHKQFIVSEFTLEVSQPSVFIALASAAQEHFGMSLAYSERLSRA